MPFYTLATMADLNVTYAGLALKSPVIIDFSDDLPSPEEAEPLEEAGAGVLMIPTLTEARLNWSPDDQEITEHNRSDAADRDTDKIRRRINLDSYLEQLENLSRKVSLPIIPSIQCTRQNRWLNLAHAMADAGASAIHLHPIVESQWRTSRTDRIEKEILRISASVAGKLDIPVTVNLVAAPYGMQTLVQNLGDSDVKGIILNGSSTLTTIDPDSIRGDTESVGGPRGEASFLNALAGLQVLYRRVSPHLACRIPPDQPLATVKALLAGATLTVLPVRRDSDSPTQTDLAQTDLEAHLGALHRWMKKHHFSNLFDFRGSLSESRLSSSLENRNSDGDND